MFRPDPYISCQACRITAKLATWGKLRFSEEERIQFVSHLMRKLTDDKVIFKMCILITLSVFEFAQYNFSRT